MGDWNLNVTQHDFNKIYVKFEVIEGVSKQKLYRDEKSLFKSIIFLIKIVFK